MATEAQRFQVNIEDEMRTSFLDYAMSVIIARALPDVRDGLKPVHRRVLLTLYDLNLTPDRGYRKCAKICGDVSGNYHPHGEGVVYPSLVRLAQPFAMRYPLVDGQGNYGCFTGDTKISVVDGTTKTFAELASLGLEARFHVYSVDRQGRIVIAEGRNARITGRCVELLEVILDNGERIRCTPEHRFMLRDRSYKHAEHLTTEDSLMPGYFDEAPVREGSNPYLRVCQPDRDGTLLQHARTYNHRVVSVRFLPEREDVYDITVDEHHNFLLAAGVFVHNSVDGDPPAAMRYTESRMTEICEEILRDLEKETVDFVPNYDGTREEPVVLPSAIPNLLMNGSSGIAVGMATNIPPHNVGELVDGLIMLLADPQVSAEELMRVIPGPDFPTAGLIYGTEGIRDAYRTGRGLITMRARAIVEHSRRTSREQIIINEIPYQVNKAKLVEKIAELVRDRKIEGISDLRDESDREGMRVVIELSRGAQAEVVLNQLYKQTPMQSTFGVIMLALVGNQPRIMPLKELMWHFLEHRRDVVTRRTRFDLRKARERAHILEGLRVALEHLDEVIRLIRAAEAPAVARERLLTTLTLTEAQAQAILDLRLQRLTALEREKILQEHAELQQKIRELEGILADEAKVRAIIQEELLAIKERYGDERRTEIVAEAVELNIEDLIPQEDVAVTVSHTGYIKRTPARLYHSQHRGGKGIKAMETKEQDFVEHFYIAHTHHYILCFTNIGKVHWLKVYEIPEGTRVSKGKALVNLLQLEDGESISAMVPVDDFAGARCLVMATKRGLVKKTPLGAFSNPRTGGIRAISLDDDDELIVVKLTEASHHIFLGTEGGQAIQFREEEVRPMGRSARGVIGIDLEEGDALVAMEVVNEAATMLTVCENGYGKRTPIDEYRVQGRGGKGLINIKVTERNGRVVGIKQVTEVDELMIMTTAGNLIRLPVRELSVISRNTQGVRLIALNDNDLVASVASIDQEAEVADVV